MLAERGPNTVVFTPERAAPFTAAVLGRFYFDPLLSPPAPPSAPGDIGAAAPAVRSYMSLFSAVWPLKDLGDLTKKGDDTKASLVLAVALPVCAAGAASIMAADGLKSPTLVARVLVGATLGATVAGTASTGLTGAQIPRLAMLSLLLGATLGMLGAASLKSEAAEGAEKERRRALRTTAAAAAAPLADKPQEPSQAAPQAASQAAPQATTAQPETPSAE